VEVGKSDISRIDKLCYHYDKLQSKWSRAGDQLSEEIQVQKSSSKDAFEIWLMNSTKK
jgi:hypothetical protein